MTNYHTYLIRFWHEEEHQSWRASLILPQTGEQHHFATADKAFAFLSEQLTAKDKKIDYLTNDES